MISATRSVLVQQWPVWICPTLKELMGHSTISMTMRYVHPTPEHKREAVRKLEQFNIAQVSRNLSGKSPHKSPDSSQSAKIALLVNY
jgi:hypothetical protein